MEDEEKKRPRRVTREELYRRVWETPMSRLAAEYGISGNGLAKICNRLNVPYPPRGWWAKKAAGKKVITYRLPPPDDSTPSAVTITPTPPPAPPPVLPPMVQERLEEAQTQGTTITVPERLTRPHRIIAIWLEDHARRKREAKRERDPWMRRISDPGDFTSMDRRRHRILDALFKELERCGGKVKEDDRKGLFVELSGEKVAFQIREKQKQVRRPLTANERRWRTSSDKDWKHELQGTGKFVFTIKTWLRGGLQTEWLETDAKPMEEMLPQIAATILAAETVLTDLRRERAEDERQRRIKEQRRAEEEARRRQDANRWKRFTELAEAWRTAELIRDFISALKAMPQPEQQETIDGRTIAEWITWAEEWLEKADPTIRGVEAIFKDIAAVTSWAHQTR